MRKPNKVFLKVGTGRYFKMYFTMEAGIEGSFY